MFDIFATLIFPPFDLTNLKYDLCFCMEGLQIEIVSSLHDLMFSYTFKYCSKSKVKRAYKFNLAKVYKRTKHMF